MDYIYLFAAMTSSAMLSITSSVFGKKNTGKKSASLLYSVFVTLSAAVVWGIICIFGEGICTSIFAYALLYGLFYVMAMIGMFTAYQIGSVSITAFVKQLSLIMVSVWGFIFWRNTVTANIITGFILIIAALYLCLKPDRRDNQRNLSLKWVIFALILLVGNSGCSIIQKYQQIEFKSMYGSSLMFGGTLIAFVASLLIYLKKGDIHKKSISKSTLIFPIVGGVSSAILNLFILLLLSSSLSESIIFPGIAVGGLVITSLFSLTFYSERLLPHQWFGLFIGVIALVFLNIG